MNIKINGTELKKVDKDIGLCDHLPFITILIPAYDEANVIGNTIEQIRKVDYPSDRYEILVATYESDIETRRVVNLCAEKFHNVREAINKRKPPTTKAQNVNNAYILIDNRTEIIGIHDAEDGTSENILKNMVCVLKNVKCAQVKIIVDIDNGSTLTEISSAVNFSRYYNLIVPGKEHLGFLTFSAGTGTYIEKCTLDKFIASDGLFLDERNLVEDFEFSIRLAKYRCKMKYEPGSYTHEKFPKKFSSAVKQRTRWSLGCIQTLVKHGLPKEFSNSEKIGLILDSLGLTSPIWAFALIISIICVVGPFAGLKFIQENSILWYISIVNTVIGLEKIVFSPYFVLKDTKEGGKIKFKYMRIILAIFLNDVINVVAVSKAIYRYTRSNLVWDKTRH